MSALHFLDEQTGWAVVVTCEETDCNPYYPKAPAKTADGGQTWQILQPQIIPWQAIDRIFRLHPA